MAFFFEDILVNLQLETIKKIGYKKTADLWYKIGKDIGTRYFLLGKIRQIPQFLLPLTINHIFSGFKQAGMSIGTQIKFDSKLLETDTIFTNSKLHIKTKLTYPVYL